MTTKPKDDLKTVWRDKRTLVKSRKSIKFRLLRLLTKSLQEPDSYIAEMTAEIILPHNHFEAWASLPVSYWKDDGYGDPPPDEAALIYVSILPRGSADDPPARWIVSLPDLIDDMIWDKRTYSERHENLDEKIPHKLAREMIKLRDRLRELADHIDANIDFDSTEDDDE